MSVPVHPLHADFAERARPLLTAGAVDAGDVLVVDAVADRYGEAQSDVLLALALALRAPRSGHVGIDLLRLSPAPELPDDAAAWLDRVAASPMVGTPGTQRPFVLQSFADGDTLLMTRRMWRDQERLAERLRALAPGLTVLTGGPGAGKTWTVQRMLAEWVGERGESMRIALAAPTGKAAARLQEALVEALPDLASSPAVRDHLARLRATTLHRLLGVRPDGSVRHGPANPLPLDVVVVDEASMVDLLLMRRLADALPDTARLVLVGDPAQLASVEAGTVLADVVAGCEGEGPLSGCLVRLTGSHRFARAPTISRIAAHLQTGAAAGIAHAVALLTGAEREPTETLAGRVGWLGVPDGYKPTVAQLDALALPYRDGYVADLLRALADGSIGSPQVRADILAGLARYRVLAVHRQGPLGVTGLDRELTSRVREGLPQRQLHGCWLGQPLLVTQNAPELDLANGDVGLVLPNEGELVAVFAAAPGSPSPVREIPLPRLPACEPALAMTVHKCQGSQFDRVALVLAGRDSPIQTRELVYTGLTRARERLDWLGDRGELEQALVRRIERASGLAPLLCP